LIFYIKSGGSSLDILEIFLTQLAFKLTFDLHFLQFYIKGKMEKILEAFEAQDFIEVIEILLKDLEKEAIIDGAIIFSGDKLNARIITGEGRITGKTLGDIEGIAKSFIEKAIEDETELFEDNLIVRRGSDSALFYRIKSIYVCPIVKGKKIEGVIYVDRVRKEEPFSQAERLWLKFLGKITHLYIDSLINELLLRELQKDIWVGNSEASIRVREQMRKLAGLSPVLILGETGTGKGLAAEILHKLSGRKGKFVTVSMPSLPESLFEAELFGSKRGAYTGAVERSGLVGEADGGTLFFDEISEIPLSLQAKLLRFLESGLYKRLGEDRERKSDCKIICASNKDLWKEVEGGRFRNDLFFRISTYTIVIPPLRERREDIEEMAKNFLRKGGYDITERALRILKNYDFPGNVRELQNLLYRIMSEAKEKLIDEDILKDFFLKKEKGDKLETIIEKMNEGQTFWEAVKNPFLDKELNREEVMEIIDRLLKKTENGKYKELLALFNLKDFEYHRFMAFLHKYRLIKKKKKIDEK